MRGDSDFRIVDENWSELQSTEPDHGFFKVCNSENEGKKTMFTRGNSYRLRFPELASLNHKVLLIVAAMMIDTNFYDKKCCLPLFCC